VELHRGSGEPMTVQFREIFLKRFPP